MSRESSPRPIPRPQPAPAVERRAVARPDPSTSGRCGFCGSRDTYSIGPEGLQEWALERWGDAALLRCHDCGRRQAISGLAPSRRVDWRLSGTLLKVFGWAFLLVGSAFLLLWLLRQAEQGGSTPTPPLRGVPVDRPPRPNAPAPNPS